MSDPIVRAKTGVTKTTAVFTTVTTVVPKKPVVTTVRGFVPSTRTRSYISVPFVSTELLPPRPNLDPDHILSDVEEVISLDVNDVDYDYDYDYENEKYDSLPRSTTRSKWYNRGNMRSNNISVNCYEADVDRVQNRLFTFRSVLYDHNCQAVPDRGESYQKLAVFYNCGLYRQLRDTPVGSHYETRSCSPSEVFSHADGECVEVWSRPADCYRNNAGCHSPIKRPINVHRMLDHDMVEEVEYFDNSTFTLNGYSYNTFCFPIVGPTDYELFNAIYNRELVRVPSPRNCIEYFETDAHGDFVLKECRRYHTFDPQTNECVEGRYLKDCETDAYCVDADWTFEA